jgi:hypothetical protein
VTGQSSHRPSKLRGRLQVNVAYFLNNYNGIAFSAARANSTSPHIFRQNVGVAQPHAHELNLQLGFERDIWGRWST